MRSPASKATLSSRTSIEFKVDADIGVVSIGVVLEGKVAAPDPAAPPVVLPEDPEEGITGNPDGLLVAGSEPCSELGARGGGLGKAADGPFVTGSGPWGT